MTSISLPVDTAAAAPRRHLKPSLLRRVFANGAVRTGSVLLSNEGNPMMTLTASTVERHDTVGGACSRESNSLRYGHHTNHQHACVDNFLLEHVSRDMGKRDMVANINFFMNVPVTPDGRLSFADGVSAPGRYVEMQADLDVLVLISNCPQLNNPCNAYNPTPVRLLVWPKG